MVEILLIASLAVGLGVLVVTLIVLRRVSGSSVAPTDSRLASIEGAQERIDRGVREEAGRQAVPIP